MKILEIKKYTILSNILKYSFVFIFGLMLLAPMVFATDAPGNTTGGGPGNTTGTGITTTIINPLGDDGPQTIPDFIEAIIEIVLIVGVPIVVLAIIYTGFLFVQAQGNPEKLTKAKNALVYTLIGAAVLLGAFVIAEAIGDTVNEISSGA